jgi:hypothetical protein
MHHRAPRRQTSHWTNEARIFYGDYYQVPQRSFANLEERLTGLATDDLGKTIDTILCDFVSMLLGDEIRRALRPIRRSRRDTMSCTNLPFRYAKCQKVYRKCPHKLVDIVVVGENTFPLRIEPAEAAKVRQL